MNDGLYHSLILALMCLCPQAFVCTCVCCVFKVVKARADAPLMDSHRSERKTFQLHSTLAPDVLYLCLSFPPFLSNSVSLSFSSLLVSLLAGFPREGRMCLSLSVSVRVCFLFLCFCIDYIKRKVLI